MTLFELLLVAHLLGDFVLQTEWQAMNKAQNWRALVTHLASYHLLILAVLIYRFGPAHWPIYPATLLLALSHAFLDRRGFITRLMRLLRSVVVRPPQPWLVIVVDQVLHLALLALATLFLTGGQVL